MYKRLATFIMIVKEWEKLGKPGDKILNYKTEVTCSFIEVE